MKKFVLQFVNSNWTLAGVGVHLVVLIALIRMFGNGFDGLFDLAWANGIDGPTPLLDLLTWIVRIGLPGGCICYAMALKSVLMKRKA